MVNSQPEALARRWFEEVWNTRREQTIDELLPDHAVGHMEGAEIRGAGDFKTVRAGLLSAFPDLKVEVEETVAQGNNVVVRWSATGTHRGQGVGVDPTNHPVRFRGMSWLRFENGRIVEGWDAWNQGALLTELQSVSASLTAATSIPS